MLADKLDHGRYDQLLLRACQLRIYRQGNGSCGASLRVRLVAPTYGEAGSYYTEHLQASGHQRDRVS